VDPEQLTNCDATQIPEKVNEYVSQSNIRARPQLSPVVNKFSNQEQLCRMFETTIFFQTN